MSNSIISSLLTSPTASKLSASKSSASLAKTNTAPQSAEEKFLDYAKKTPAEKLRASLLAGAGVTEEQLQSMSPDQRKAIEQKIADQVKQAAEKQASKGQGASGFFTDMKV
jgi:hypothetical protein